MPVNQYKKAEKEFANRIGGWLRRAWTSVVAFLRLVVQKGRQRFTVMLIPHSEKKIFNFQISFFTLVFVTSTLAVVLVGFVVLATHFTGTNERYVEADRLLKQNESTLTGFKDEIASSRPLVKQFKDQMDAVLRLIGSTAYTESGSGGPLPATADIIEGDAAAGMRELSDLRSIDSAIRNSIDPLREINGILKGYQSFIDWVPTFWPLRGGYGNVTTKFGWTTHPFTRRGYLHTGLDIAWPSGVPVVVTANGTVSQVGYTSDLGNFVTVEHKYGFYTKYAHLNDAIVYQQQVVKRGQVIGYLGNTGLSTGPHLHYEVRLGTEYRDPMNFLMIKPEVAAAKIDGRSGD